MKREAFQQKISKKTTFLDGATGTFMAAHGMPRDCCVEAWLLEHPELVRLLQEQYVAAGSEIIYAPTFSANRISLKKHHAESELVRLNTELAALSLSIADGKALVAGDMTTTGELLEPLGDLEEEELYEVYKEQAVCLEAAGADLIVAETMLSVDETVVLAKAVLAETSLPLICSLTVQEGGRALFGGTASEGVERLQALGASAVGINCSMGPSALKEIVKDMKAVAKVPILVKPNAGMPVQNADGTASYTMIPEEFGAEMEELVEAGANLIGGCCGTGPAFIRELVKRFS